MTDTVIIIAEAGVNHNGSLELAKKLIDVAKEAGADYVKFQTFKAENLVSRKAKKAAYQRLQNPVGDEFQYDMLKKLELDEDKHIELVAYCKEKQIKFLSTAFDEEGIDFLFKLGVDVFKIPSGEVTNLPYLKKVAGMGLPVILSTGMSTIKEVEDAISILMKNGTSLENLTVLHCNTEYPTPYEDVNLLAMNHIRQTFDVKVGYSDHTLGIEVPIAAVALGAVVIEKHFTLNREMEGPDHKASLEPLELKEMVSAVKNIVKSLGSGVKQPSGSELKNIPVARKSIHLKKPLKSGQTITADILVMKRPGDGISPMKMEEIIGKTINRDLDEDTQLRPEHLN